MPESACPPSPPDATAPAAPARWRLFFALDPGAELRRRLAAHSALWRWDARTRVSSPDKLHLTLVFMPAVDERDVAELLRAGADAAVTQQGCDLLLDRCAVWPGGIAHLAPSRTPHSLLCLHDTLLHAVRAAGVRADARNWSPHLTLARRATPEQAPEPFAPLHWQVRSFSLQRSLLGSGRYQTLGRWRLRDPAPEDAQSRARLA